MHKINLLGGSGTQLMSDELAESGRVRTKQRDTHSGIDVATDVAEDGEILWRIVPFQR
jgi:hypothetical protein